MDIRSERHLPLLPIFQGPTYAHDLHILFVYRHVFMTPERTLEDQKRMNPEKLVSTNQTKRLFSFCLGRYYMNWP